MDRQIDMDIIIEIYSYRLPDKQMDKQNDRYVDIQKDRKIYRKIDKFTCKCDISGVHQTSVTCRLPYLNRK